MGQKQTRLSVRLASERSEGRVGETQARLGVSLSRKEGDCRIRLEMTECKGEVSLVQMKCDVSKGRG